MDKETIEVGHVEVRCPVCMQIPMDKILQCVNGHNLCSSCSSRLPVCPLCRICLKGKGRVRNLFMEAILDKFVVNCPFAEEGCNEKLNRKDVYHHLRICRFAHMIHLCKQLGFTDCDFKTCTLNAVGVLSEHLVESHGCVSSSAASGANHELVWEHFYNSDHPQRKESICHLLRLDMNSSVDFLLFCKQVEDYTSWLCFYYSDGCTDEQISKKFKLQLSAMGIHYQIPVVSMKNIEVFLKHHPFRVYNHQMIGVNQAFVKIKMRNDASLRISARITSRLGMRNQMRSVAVLYGDNTSMAKDVSISLDRPIRQGTILRVLGKVPEHAKTFNIDLLSEERGLIEGLRMVFKLKAKALELVEYCLSGTNGHRKVKVELRKGKQFDIELKCDDKDGNCYHLKINGVNYYQGRGFQTLYTGIINVKVYNDAVVSLIAVED